MRKNDKVAGILYLAALALMMPGFSSCVKDEIDAPVIIENPMEMQNYYMLGTISDENGPLEGVKVSTDGMETTTDAQGRYRLVTSTPKEYYLKIEKDNYVTVKALVSFPSNAEKPTIILTNQRLSKKKFSSTLLAGSNNILQDPNSVFKAVISAPAGALS